MTVGRYWLLAAILFWLPLGSQAEHHEVAPTNASSNADLRFGLNLEQRKAVFRELAGKYGLTIKQAEEISAEGFAHSWPAKLP